MQPARVMFMSLPVGTHARRTQHIEVNSRLWAWYPMSGHHWCRQSLFHGRIKSGLTWAGDARGGLSHMPSVTASATVKMKPRVKKSLRQGSTGQEALSDQVVKRANGRLNDHCAVVLAVVKGSSSQFWHTERVKCSNCGSKILTDSHGRDYCSTIMEWPPLNKISSITWRNYRIFLSQRYLCGKRTQKITSWG